MARGDLRSARKKPNDTGPLPKSRSAVKVRVTALSDRDCRSWRYVALTRAELDVERNLVDGVHQGKGLLSRQQLDHFLMSRVQRRPDLTATASAVIDLANASIASSIASSTSSGSFSVRPSSTSRPAVADAILDLAPNHVLRPPSPSWPNRLIPPLDLVANPLQPRPRRFGRRCGYPTSPGLPTLLIGSFGRHRQRD